MAKIQSNTPLDIAINGTTVFTANSSGIIITGSLNSTTPVTSASYAETASFINSLNQNVVITGSLTVITGSAVELLVTNTGVTIGNLITDTHTLTGSFNISGSLLVNGAAPGGSSVKAGSGSAASFGGSPRTASFVFTSAFSNNSYAVAVTGEDARSWSIQSKTSTGFTINTNSTIALTAPVYWIATPFGS